MKGCRRQFEWKKSFKKLFRLWRVVNIRKKLHKNLNSYKISGQKIFRAHIFFVSRWDKEEKYGAGWCGGDDENDDNYKTIFLLMMIFKRMGEVRKMPVSTIKIKSLYEKKPKNFIKKIEKSMVENERKMPEFFIISKWNQVVFYVLSVFLGFS